MNYFISCDFLSLYMNHNYFEQQLSESRKHLGNFSAGIVHLNNLCSNVIFHAKMGKAVGYFSEEGGKIATKHQTKSLEEKAYKEIQVLIQQMAV